MKFIVSAAALVVIAAGIKATSALLIPLVLAGFLAIITFPLVRWLQEHRVHRLAAVLITMLAVLGALLGPGLLVATAIRQFAQAAPEYETRLRQLVLASGGWLRDRNIDATHLSTILDPSLVFGFVVTTLSGVLTLLSIVFLVVLVSAFLLMESADVADRRSEALPGRAREMIAAVGRQMQVWLWVKTLISLATGAAAGLWVGLMGIEFALLWGLVAFLLNYIPNFGSLSAAVVALGYVVINVVFGSVLEPYFMSRQIGLSPVVVLLSVIVWGWLWGPIGMLLAVPITMSVKFGLESSSESRWLGRLLGGNTG
jgi:predicted PurR-regulated permease PerM